MSSKVNIAILGAGSWGLTLTWLLATNHKQVTLWSHNPEKARALAEKRTVENPLPVTIPPSVVITSDLKEAVRSEIILFCCSSQAMREVGGRVASVLADQAQRKPVLVSCAKGLELHSLKRMSEVLSEAMPGASVCALSGPNLASEILKGLPTASVIASHKEEAMKLVQSELKVSTLRFYTNADLKGVELGGTLKNIIAIAAGISDGLHLGANAKAALLTRGLAEMTRLAVKLGAQSLTLAGLSGMGDLFATCTSVSSRNYRLGLELAHGRSLAESLAILGATAEGVTTCEAVCELSKRLGIELPIAEQVESTLKGINTPKEAIMALLNRPLASEL